jgi:hypothetical protein
MDLESIYKSLIPPAIGVAFGVLARWSQEAKAGRVRSIRRMILLDVPTLGALTVISGTVAQHFDADPITAAGIGVCAGYIGIQIIGLLVTWKTGLQPPLPGQVAPGDAEPR